MAKQIILTDEAYEYVIDIVGQKQIEFADNGVENMEEALGDVLEQLDEAVDVTTKG